MKKPSSKFQMHHVGFRMKLNLVAIYLQDSVLVRPRRRRRGRAFQGEAEPPPEEEEEEKTVTTLPVPPLLPHCSKSHPRSPDPTTIKVPGRAKETTATRRIRRREKNV